MKGNICSTAPRFVDEREMFFHVSLTRAVQQIILDHPLIGFYISCRLYGRVLLKSLPLKILWAFQTSSLVCLFRSANFEGKISLINYHIPAVSKNSKLTHSAHFTDKIIYIPIPSDIRRTLLTYFILIGLV